ncbi:MAG: hypothetical protein KDC95_17915 [Planctomycetes bacterium]|nr:hypothetical protein [Planctomycetota bacterium]
MKPHAVLARIRALRHAFRNQRQVARPPMFVLLAISWATTISCGSVGPGAPAAYSSAARVLEIGSRSIALPGELSSPERIRALRAHVEGGGALFLRGRAVRLLDALGLATTQREALVVNHGFLPARRDEASAIGLGFTEVGSGQLGIDAGPLWLCDSDLWRAEIDPIRIDEPAAASRASDSAGVAVRAHVFAEQFRRVGDTVRRLPGAVLCGFEVGNGRVLALGMASDHELPRQFVRCCHDWLAQSEGATAPAVVFDGPPRPDVDGWGPPAALTISEPAAIAVRVPASVLDDETIRGRLVGNGLDVVIVEDDGADLEVMVRRSEFAHALGFGFGLAARALRLPLVPLLEWRGETPPALDTFMEVPGPRLDGTVHDLEQVVRQNATTRLLRSRPTAIADAACTAYLSSDSGNAAGMPIPAVDADLLPLLPPSFYRAAEFDARRARGGRVDAIHERCAAFVRGRPGSTIVLRTSASDLEDTLVTARAIQRPFGHAVCMTEETHGPDGFLEIAHRDVLPVSNEAIDRKLSSRSLHNRWFRVANNAIDIDPAGFGRFDDPVTCRVSSAWSKERIHGMRIGDPALFERILAPSVIELDGFMVEADRPRSYPLELDVGRYDIELVVTAVAEPTILELRDSSRRVAYFAIEAGRANRYRISLDIVDAKTASLTFGLCPAGKRAGTQASIERCSIRGRGIEAEAEVSPTHAALVAESLTETTIGHYEASRCFRTRGDLPAVVECLRIRGSVAGLELERTLRFDGYRIVRRDTPLPTSREDRFEHDDFFTRRRVGFDLEPTAGGPRLRLLFLDPGRMQPSQRDGAIQLRGHPRSHEECVLALVLTDALPETVSELRLRRALLALAHEDHHATLAAPGRDGTVAPRWPQLLPHEDGKGRTKILDARSDAMTVESMGAAPGGVAPYLDFGDALPVCRVDGVPWFAARGSNLLLPKRAGTRRIEWGRARYEGPRLLATRAVIEAMSYDDATREFKIVVDAPAHAEPNPLATFRLRIAANTPARVQGAALVSARYDGVFELDAPRGTVVIGF